MFLTRFAPTTLFLALFAGTLGAQADNHDKKKSKVAPAKAATYKIDPSETKLEWTGQKPAVMGYRHTGTVNVKSGALEVKGTELVGGTVVVDMTTVQVTDLQGEKAEGLKRHLLYGNDFFAVYEGDPKKPESVKIIKDHAESTLTILSVTPKPADGYTHEIKGKLKIRNKVADIAFPAKIEVEGDRLTAEGKLAVDRTKHDVKFGSTLLGAVGDKLIDDVFTVHVKLAARK